MEAHAPSMPAVALSGSKLTLSDLRAALAAGWTDFTTSWRFGLFFGGFYAAVGLFLAYALLARHEASWLAFAIAGFPLITPFVAVGLYEISRRREAGLELSWRDILLALRGRGEDQLALMGCLLFVGFTFWVGVAHGISTIFLAETNINAMSPATLLSGGGLAFLLVGGGVGAILAFTFYAITLVSLPLMVDRDIDLFTAAFMSMAAVRANMAVLSVWAAVIAITLFAAMLPGFAGLLVALPVLAHATWHLYRRLIV